MDNPVLKKLSPMIILKLMRNAKFESAGIYEQN